MYLTNNTLKVQFAVPLSGSGTCKILTPFYWGKLELVCLLLFTVVNYVLSFVHRRARRVAAAGPGCDVIFIPAPKIVLLLYTNHERPVYHII